VISKRQFAQLAEYCIALRGELFLHAWRIELLFVPPDNEDAFAQIEPISGRYVANLRVCSDFMDIPPKKQREILTHELLHLIVWETDQIVFESHLNIALGSAWILLEERYRVAREIVTDRMTTLIADGMPLPAWAKK
jgi:hypothetical protein